MIRKNPDYKKYSLILYAAIGLTICVYLAVDTFYLNKANVNPPSVTSLNKESVSLAAEEMLSSDDVEAADNIDLSGYSFGKNEPFN